MEYFYNVNYSVIEFWKAEKECAHKDNIWKLWEQLLTFGGMIIEVIFLPACIYVFFIFMVSLYCYVTFEMFKILIALHRKKLMFP